MSIQISCETEGRITDGARRQGVSVEALLARLPSDDGATHVAAANGSAPTVPILHLGVVGALHRRDIYDDAR